MTVRTKVGYIPEIVGLRGLALTMVVLFHLLGRGRVSGGVDVFLFLSGLGSADESRAEGAKCVFG